MTTTSKLNAQTLAPHLPEGAPETVAALLNSKSLSLKITRPRKTKIGDYRPPQKKGDPHQITVNGDLNKYSFLVTLIHEFAHLTTFEKYRNQKIRPHGKEWKSEFQQLLKPFVDKELFPASIKTALDNYLKNPSAATCTDYQLMQALRQFDQKQSSTIPIEEIPDNGYFIYGKNRIFRKEGKLRKRLRCFDLKTKKYYLFNPVAEVKPYREE